MLCDPRHRASGNQPADERAHAPLKQRALRCALDEFPQFRAVALEPVLRDLQEFAIL